MLVLLLKKAAMAEKKADNNTGYNVSNMIISASNIFLYRMGFTSRGATYVTLHVHHKCYCFPAEQLICLDTILYD